jgi:hypothetical protein
VDTQDDDFDPASFAVTPELVALNAAAHAAKAARRNTGGGSAARNPYQYQKGFLTVPQAWNEALAKIPYTPAHAVALCLLRRRWSDRVNSFPIGNIAFSAAGVTKYTKAQALQCLEAAGLIAIEPRGRRKSPFVTLKRLE